MIKMAHVVLLAALPALPVQTPAPGVQNSLLRRYVAGEKLTYHMKGINEGWHYEAQADGIVKKDADGSYFEDFGWSKFVFDGQRITLSPATLNFRQRVTLDPKGRPAFPNLSQADPRLIGPLTDFMTFYVDLWLAVKTGALTHPGDHFYFKKGTPNSWADGTDVLVGHDSIDFDLTYESTTPAGDVATILVRHVPPEKPQIELPAEWMRAPVSGTPNNWVQIEKTGDGKYLSAVGKETFDVELKVSLADGKILSATQLNPVLTIERECADVALTSCGAAKPHNVMRHIEIALVR